VFLLALDAALARCSAAVLVDGRVAAEGVEPGGRGHGAVLAPLVCAVLADAGYQATRLDGVAVTIGPGSFTGLRSAIALAQGIALAAGCPVVGVTVAEALAAALPALPDWSLWVAIDSRRGRVFLDRAGAIEAVALAALPVADGPIAVAGDAAIEVAARLAARNDTVMLTGARLPLARHLAVVGERRLRGELPPLPARPLYIDPPEARLPAGGLRQSPQA